MIELLGRFFFYLTNKYGELLTAVAKLLVSDEVVDEVEVTFGYRSFIDQEASHNFYGEIWMKL